jgi:hypothetical protein
MAARIAVALLVICAVAVLVSETRSGGTPPSASPHAAPRADAVMAGTVPAPPTTVAAPPTTAAQAVAPRRVAAAAPAQARADRVVFDRTPDDVGREALAMIRYPWRDRLHATIRFEGPRAGLRAHSTAYADHEDITVYVRSTDTPTLVAVSIAHELGHLIDYRYLTDNDRQQWLQERGRSGLAWWTCDSCNDYRVGSGDFAETFAAWEVSAIDYRSEVGPMPGADQLQSLSRFFV